jgi:hypothetical protein
VSPVRYHEPDDSGNESHPKRKRIRRHEYSDSSESDMDMSSDSENDGLGKGPQVHSEVIHSEVTVCTNLFAVNDSVDKSIVTWHSQGMLLAYTCHSAVYNM